MSDAISMKDWHRYRFDQMALMVNDRIDDPGEANEQYYVGLEHLDSDSLTIRRWGSPSDVTATKLRFRAGDIIFGRRRVYQRKLAVADFNGICSAHAMVLRAKPAVALPEFLPFFMQSDLFMERAREISVGSLSPTINWKALAQEKFTLPSLSEQRSLASLLATADSVSESLLRLLECQRIAEAALFDKVVSRAEPPSVLLGSLLTEPPRNGFSAHEKDEETGHWVLSLGAITKWGYRSGELKSVDKTPAMVAALLSKGDLVISRSNTLDLVGLPAIFDEDRCDISRPDTMMQLKPDESRLRKRFLELYLRSPAGRRQIQSYAAGTSASMKKVNATNVAKLEIPLPDLNVQLELEQMTDAMRQGRFSLEAHRGRSRQLRMILLNEVVAGTDGCR
jgi:type I restriction enzyme S subunit